MPSLQEQFKNLLEIDNSSEFKENLKKFNKFKNLAQEKFEKAMQIDTNLSKRVDLINEAWENALKSIKNKPNSPAMWELIGDCYFELTRPDHAILAYKKSLEFNPENDDKLKQKISELSKLNSLFFALERKKIPAEIELLLLKCINCGASGKLYPYRDVKNYTVSQVTFKMKMTSNIIVPLCEKCIKSPKYSARRNLRYGINGAVIRAGSGNFDYLSWKKYTILEKYKSGQLSPEILEAFHLLEKK